MNRFRTKKRVKDDLAAPVRPVETESAGPFRMFGKKKAQEEEPKKELDLADALPSNDDFRTSLLMTNLSARFSMLREQDDPNTKLGKASDDSVLFPKRQSRMMDFGFGAGLDDIAEVESIRAPFARTQSYASDDAASISGSIMTRGKPTEGNNLFGGRQKVYKVASGSKSGALSGRTLYDDDISQSAFQKWRQSEREKEVADHGLRDSLEVDEPGELARPDSSQQDFSRRRETSSTTSSGPSAARNSTAATSINSSKDWAATNGAASPTPPMERHVMRTRRLYEQGLNQDLQDQQSSALSRIDTLSRRTLGNRTPDLTPTAPSPSSATFPERLVNHRSILNKTSVPNLKSFSPPSTSTHTSPVDSTNRFLNLEERLAFGATPPLSPPISETGDSQAAHKTSSIGSFMRTSSQYDEAKFAQRQVQMQRDRENSIGRVRADSNTSNPSGVRSRSSSTHRTTFEKHDSGVLRPEPTVQEEIQSSTFFEDEEGDEPVRNSTRSVAPQVTVERPDDHEHPALRSSAIPIPLSLTEKTRTLSVDLPTEPPEDSPTLGPTSGGLSGMVRAHMRQDSGASSVYGTTPNEAELSSRFPPEREEAQLAVSSYKSNPWDMIDHEVAMSMEDDNIISPTQSKDSIEHVESHERTESSTSTSLTGSRPGSGPEREKDEFARHLADGARRVRERLTSYVETDSGHSSPVPPPLSELPPPPPRHNALGILRAKSSRGSLVDKNNRGADKENHNQSKAMKLLGLGSVPASAPASPHKLSFESQSPTEEQFERGRPSAEREDGSRNNMKALRQARREQQRMREMEAQQRYPPAQPPTHAPPLPPMRTSQPQEPPMSFGSRVPSRSRSRAPSQEPTQDRRPPPVAFNRMPGDGTRSGSNSRSGSRAGSRAPSERERSGSETSNGGRSASRTGRLRNESITRDELGRMSPVGGPHGMHRQGPPPMARSPGFQGPDGKFSPHMPPQGYHPSPSPGRFRRPTNPDATLNIQPVHNLEAGQPSPISPMNGLPSPYAPNFHRPHPQQHPGGMMRNRDMSEPTLGSQKYDPMGARDGMRGPGGFSNSVMSSPNMHGEPTAPPLPPINPRRKNHGAPFSPTSGDEGQDEARRLQQVRKAASEANGLNARARAMRNSPPLIVTPQIPANVNGNPVPGGMI